MKWLWNAKDGGPESKVWMWGVESKRLGSICLLKFDRGSREAYHTHAFDAVSWVLSGHLYEQFFNSDKTNQYGRSFKPVFTGRQTFHKVTGIAPKTWVLSFRGPWVDKWMEFNNNGMQQLTHGREQVV